MGRIHDRMRIVFRADASVDIGMGHLMRCLTLANALSARGHECLFVTRAGADGFLAPLRDAEHEIHQLTATPEAGGYGPHDAAPAHAAWLAGDWRSDAAQTRDILRDLDADWFVLDHYALDAAWEGAALPPAVQLAVIDDLFDRPHRADLLVDQNIAITRAAYDGLVPGDCHVLAGPEFALLRPEFAALRPAALARRRHGRLEHLLIAMGGVDRDNATATVLAGLQGVDLPEGMRITVVLGANAPHHRAVETLAADMKRPTRLCSDVRDMAGLMADADLAIGAAGSSSWERCCLGLPSIVLMLAGNQRRIAGELDRAGAAICLTGATAPRLQAAFSRLREKDALADMAQVAARLCDGNGATTVVSALENLRLVLRPATASDCDPVFAWRSAADPGLYRSGSRPTLDQHRRWFSAALQDPARRLLIVSGGGRDLGHLRFDVPKPEGPVELSIYLDPQARGKGHATAALHLARRYAKAEGWCSIRAEVHVDNSASLRLFEKAGYVRGGARGAFLEFSRAIWDKAD